MRAIVTISKSFDDSTGFSKEWESGDFEDFFTDEGRYIDTLAEKLNGLNIEEMDGDGFTVTYVVTVRKQKIREV